MTSVSGNLATEQRLDWLRDRLAREGSVRLADSAAALQVSEMTVRRDLQHLESMGLARRVRGGALPLAPAAFADRHESQARAKSRIASKLLPLVPSRGAIGIDASTTVMRLAGVLSPRESLTVLTNGPTTFTALSATPGVRAILTGGELDTRTGSLVGPLAVHGAGQLMLRRLFMSSAGVDPVLGCGETCLEEAEVKQSLARVAEDVVLAVDSTKLGLRGTAIGLGWDRVRLLVTELEPTSRQLEQYRGYVELL